MRVCSRGSLRRTDPCGRGVGRPAWTWPICGPPRPIPAGVRGVRAPRFPGGWHSAPERRPRSSPEVLRFQEQRNPAWRSASLRLCPELPASPRAKAGEQKSRRPPRSVTPPALPCAGRAVGQLSPFSPVRFARLGASSEVSGSDASPRTALLEVGMGRSGGAHLLGAVLHGGPRGDSRPPPNPLRLCNGGTAGLQRRSVHPSPPCVPAHVPAAPPWGSPPAPPPPNIPTVPLQVLPRRAAPACSSVSPRSSAETRRSYRHDFTSSGPPRVPAARSPYP